MRGQKVYGDGLGKRVGERSLYEWTDLSVENGSRQGGREAEWPEDKNSMSSV